jgi:hypothetical protein
VIRASARAGGREALAAVSGEINAALGEAILARPEQWLWGSRRFAQRPPGEIPGPDGLPPQAPRRAGRLAPDRARESA